MRLLDHDTGYDVICARMWNTTVCLILGDFLDSTVGRGGWGKLAAFFRKRYISKLTTHF